MLSKLFKRKSVPENSGKSQSSQIDKLNYVKVFELELSNMEDTPVYTLTHQLSVGSEIGNIIISDLSVSPRHASFILQEDVVSVIDHGSVAGTFVNGKKIPAGKYVILQESDIILVGDLEIRIRASRATVKASEEEVPEVSPPEELPEEAEVTTPGEEVSEAEPESPKQVKDFYNPPAKNKTDNVKAKAKPKKKKPLVISAPQPAANALVRVLAILTDFIVSYGLLIILSPFDEFRDFIKFVPETLSSFVEVDWSLVWTMIKEDYGFAADMLHDGYAFLSGMFDFVPLLIVFIMLRLISTLLFGVSLSEFFLGVKAAGNGIWKRVGGMIRVVVGLITWPMIIFDLPALVSRRTLKEVLTFTRIYNPSKFITILGILFYLPMTLGFVLVAPMFQGFEPPEPLLVNERIDQRVKVKVPPVENPVPESAGEDATVENVPEGTPQEIPETAPVPEVVTKQASSGKIQVQISFSPQELKIFPDFKFKGIKSKRKVSSLLLFYQKELQRPVEMEIFKFFDFKQLLGIGIRGNIFLHDKYPHLSRFVYEASDNPAFRKQSGAADHLAFATEFIQFTKLAFTLSLDNFTEVIQNETPLIKSLVDYKASFLAMLEYKDFDEVDFARIGNAVFMRIRFTKQRPFDLLIPLIRGEGKIFKVTFDKKDNLITSQSKFYKYNLNETDWTKATQGQMPRVASALDVFDLFSDEKYKDLFTSSELAQSLYGYYFETSASVIKDSDPVEIDLWKDKVISMLQLLEEIPSTQVEGQEDVKTKMLQNFRDMIDALETNNAGYFGISTTTTI